MKRSQHHVGSVFDSNALSDGVNLINLYQVAAGIIEVKDKFGFDVRYILDGSKLNIQNEELVVKSDSKSDLLKGFRKFASSKSQQRVFVQKFIPEIA